MTGSKKMILGLYAYGADPTRISPDYCGHSKVLRKVILNYTGFYLKIPTLYQ